MQAQTRNLAVREMMLFILRTSIEDRHRSDALLRLNSSARRVKRSAALLAYGVSKRITMVWCK
jgi:hypothetical protein